MKNLGSTNKIAFKSKADHPRTVYMLFCSCDLDLDPVTLVWPKYSEDVPAYH